MLKINSRKIGIFSRKNLSLDTNSRQNMKRLATRMRAETKDPGGEYVRCVEYLNRIENKDMSFGTFPFIDTASFIVFNKADKSGIVSDRIYVQVDKKSGKVTEYQKPLFMSWKKIMKSISDNLNDMIKNFYDEKHIERSYLGQYEWTPEGVKKLQADDLY